MFPLVSLLWLLLALVGAFLIYFILDWFVGYIQLSEPFLKIAKVIIGLIVVLFLIGAIAAIFGHPVFRW